jgi:hypothetical protein
LTEATSQNLPLSHLQRTRAKLPSSIPSPVQRPAAVSKAPLWPRPAVQPQVCNSIRYIVLCQASNKHHVLSHASAGRPGYVNMGTPHMNQSKVPIAKKWNPIFFEPQILRPAPGRELPSYRLKSSPSRNVWIRYNYAFKPKTQKHFSRLGWTSSLQL